MNVILQTLNRFLSIGSLVWKNINNALFRGFYYGKCQRSYCFDLISTTPLPGFEQVFEGSHLSLMMNFFQMNDITPSKQKPVQSQKNKVRTIFSERCSNIILIILAISLQERRCFIRLIFSSHK